MIDEKSGVLEVLDREGVRVDFIDGSSTGGLIGALHATGLAPRDVVAIARSFRFPLGSSPVGLKAGGSACRLRVAGAPLGS